MKRPVPHGPKNLVQITLLEAKMEGSDFADRNAKQPETISEQARSLGREAKAAASDATEKVRSTFEEQAAKIGDKAKDVAADAGEKVQDALSRQRAAGADYM